MKMKKIPAKNSNMKIGHKRDKNKYDRALA